MLHPPGGDKPQAMKNLQNATQHKHSKETPGRLGDVNDLRTTLHKLL